jgi:hypothetical protein
LYILSHSQAAIKALGFQLLLEMKLQIYWQEQDLNIHSQDLNQLAASQLEFPRKQSGTG